MPEIVFVSVKAINKAIHESMTNGREVRVRQIDQTLGGNYYTPITRARSDSDGALWVRLVATGKWIMCTWGDVITTI
jgi:hypothetical protein